MDTKTMINQLKYEAEKHKNDSLFTGQTNITALCSDVIPKLEKLAEYETAEEDGRLVVLPVGVGDEVYIIEKCSNRRRSIISDDQNVFFVEYEEDWDPPFGDIDGIIAWMPLPEPYRPERK